MSEGVLNYPVLLGAAFKPEEIELLKRCPMFAAALERVTCRHEFEALCVMGGALLIEKPRVPPPIT